MQPTSFLITGFPGVGKLTVSRALVEQLEADGDTARLIDNHSINNPIFRLVENDGLTPLPPAVRDRVGEMWMTTIRTLESLTPRLWHLVFTMYLDGVTDTGMVPRLAELAATRSSVFVPVTLLCDPAENARRIVSPERQELMKSIDGGEPHRLNAAGPPYDSGHPNGLTLDVTTEPPEATAAAILSHAVELDAERT